MKKIIALLLTLGILLSFAVISAHAETEPSGNPLIGDVDGDRVVEIRDATFIQRHLLNIEIPFAFDESAADADEDGEVTIMDVTNLQRWLIGAGDRLNIGQDVIPWFDKSDFVPDDSYISGSGMIFRICQSCFYLYDEIYNCVFKINGVLPEKYCVYDTINFTVTNTFCVYDDYLRYEGDLMFIYPEELDPYVAYKPVIYLYPEQETGVDVKLDINGSFAYTEPAYEDGWHVTAAPDGKLTDQDGKVYPYLFWEANLNTEYDFSEGFCVKGSETEAFLRESLTTMGLNQQETDDFIDFWLRYMKDNPYNVISFQTTAYTDAAKLDITPQPDTTIRVFMAWYGSDEAIDIPEQTLPSAQRSGFTAVEWGGQMCR